MTTRELPYENAFHNSITYELSLMQRLHTRSVYSILDFLAKCGGFTSAVSSFCVFVVAVVQFNGPLQFLMANLYIDG